MHNQGQPDVVNQMRGGEKTLPQLVAEHFAQPSPVTPVWLERNGIRVGGVLVVRGEREFEMITSLFKPAEERNDANGAKARELSKGAGA